MNKFSLAPIAVFLIFIAGCTNPPAENNTAVKEADTAGVDADAGLNINNDEPVIHPISHATFVIEWNDIIIYNDPTGGKAAFKDFENPDIILISDIHGDHMNRETLDSLNADAAVVVAPVAVADQIKGIFENIKILHNGDEAEIKGVKIEAIPMYNLPETADSRHPKGRGNGYVLTLGETRIYISGDTEDIEEMRALEDIDIAFVCMNLPYTMPVEQAADGVIAFAPKVVYPYHFRGQGGLSDVNRFKELVDAADKDIEVRIEDWYEEMP